MEELSVPWEGGVKSMFKLEPGPSLLDITYPGTVPRRDLQWTQSFVVELADDAVVTLDEENRDFAMVPLDGIDKWLESHDACESSRATVRKAGDIMAFKSGSLGQLKADALQRVHAMVSRRRQRREDL